MSFSRLHFNDTAKLVKPFYFLGIRVMPRARFLEIVYILIYIHYVFIYPALQDA